MLNIIKLLLLVVLAVAAVLLIADGAPVTPAYESVLRVSDGRVISFDEMIGEVSKSDIIFVGENHESQRDHIAELDVIEAFHKREVPLAVGLEMFRAEDQQFLDRWIRGDLDEKTFIIRYYANWNLPWPFYSDIFLYAKDHSLPLIGLNIPVELAGKIASGGFKSLTGEDLMKLPPGISCDVDEKYMDFIKKSYTSHDHSGKSFVNFCEAQMVWDKSMAWNLLDYKKKNPKKKIIVLAGTGHSWKMGIPSQIKKDSKYSFKVILPEEQEMVNRGKVSINDADYVLLR